MASTSIEVVCPFNLNSECAYSLYLVYDILDDLFFMRLELEAGEIPQFPTTPIFRSIANSGPVRFNKDALRSVSDLSLTNHCSLT